MTRPSTLRDIALLLIVSYAAFWFGIGKLGFIDPDEPFYALTAREMVQSGDWLTPQIFGEPQFEKPIFYYWMAAGSFALFGESEFTGRLPTSAAATVLALLTYFIGRRLFSPRVGLIAGLYMATSVEMIVMGRLMLTDIPLTIFVSGSLYCYWLAITNPDKRDRWIFWHMVCTGMAVLTKGPIGSLVPIMSTISYSLFTKQPLLLRGRGFWRGLAAYAVIVVPWYGYMFVKHGRPFFDEFFVRDNWMRFLVAEHPANNQVWYYPGVLLLGSIPWLPAAFLATRDLFSKVRDDRPRLFVKCWFLANLMFLTAAASKLPSYGYYLFVPVALMIGWSVDRVLTHGFRSRTEKGFIIGAMLLQTGAALVAPTVIRKVMPMASVFSPTIYFFGGLMAIGAILLLTQRYRLWLGATSVAGIGFIAFALVVQADKVERVASTKPIALKMMDMQLKGEPLMGNKFSVRGIHFYTKQPVMVIANNSQPFWAAHNALTVVSGKRELEKMLRQAPSALVTMRLPEWHKYHSYEQFRTRDQEEWFGQNLLIRAHSDQKLDALAAEEKEKAKAAPISTDAAPTIQNAASQEEAGENAKADKKADDDKDDDKKDDE